MCFEDALTPRLTARLALTVLWKRRKVNCARQSQWATFSARRRKTLTKVAFLSMFDFFHGGEDRLRRDTLKSILTLMTFWVKWVHTPAQTVQPANGQTATLCFLFCCLGSFTTFIYLFLRLLRFSCCCRGDSTKAMCLILSGKLDFGWNRFCLTKAALCCECWHSYQVNRSLVWM